jgi:protein-disulfide isomerase
MLLSIAAALWFAAATPATAPVPLPDDEVLATVNGVAIRRADLRNALTSTAKQEYADALDDLRDIEHSAARDFAGRQAIEREAAQQHVTTDAIYARIVAENYGRFGANLRNRIEQQRERIFNAERATVDEVIEKTLLEQAARAKGMSVEELNRSLANQIAPVTRQDLEFIAAYENSKQSVSQSTPPGMQRVEAAIRTARVEQAKRALIESQRAEAKIDTHLTAPRVAVSAAGAPTLGSPSAPVQIVAFTDFECTYCRDAEATVKRLRGEYGDKLAISYRNFPLPNHLYAKPSAIAAECAAEQGKYFPYHDLLFARAAELAHADYTAWAESVGLNRARFETCRASAEPWQRIERDIRDGVAAGVVGTPTFFVNGRLVKDAAMLEGVVREEMGGK